MIIMALCCRVLSGALQIENATLCFVTMAFLSFKWVLKAACEVMG